MAITTTTYHLDDIDGTTEDVRTVTFSVDGAHYEIDLSRRNHAKLTEALALFVDHARAAPSPTTSQRSQRGGTTQSSSGALGSATVSASARDVRAWAQNDGDALPERVRVPAAVFSAHAAAPWSGPECGRR